MGPSPLAELDLKERRSVLLAVRKGLAVEDPALSGVAVVMARRLYVRNAVAVVAGVVAVVAFLAVAASGSHTTTSAVIAVLGAALALFSATAVRSASRAQRLNTPGPSTDGGGLAS